MLSLQQTSEKKTYRKLLTKPLHPPFHSSLFFLALAFAPSEKRRFSVVMWYHKKPVYVHAAEEILNKNYHLFKQVKKYHQKSKNK